MYNTKVERHSFGISKVSEYSQISEGAAAHEYLQKKAVMEHCAAIDDSAVQSAKDYENQQQVNKVYQRQITESQIPEIINTLGKSGKDIVFKDIMFEMFSKSLVLDPEFVTRSEESLRGFLESYIDGKGGYALLENSIKTSNSPFLKSIKAICESTSRTVTRRKLSDAQQDKLSVDAIKFELNDEERQELDYEKEKINVEELSAMVQKKVLTVVKDEKTRQAKEKEIYEDLQANAEGEEQGVEESIRRSLIREMPVEESTLFNSLFRHSYKEALESAVSASTSEEEDDFNPDSYNVNADEDDLTDDGSRSDNTSDKETRSHGAVQSDIDMDLILAESITKYTLMELAQSIQLENYDYTSIRKLSQKLLN